MKKSTYFSFKLLFIILFYKIGLLLSLESSNIDNRFIKESQLKTRSIIESNVSDLIDDNNSTDTKNDLLLFPLNVLTLEEQFLNGLTASIEFVQTEQCKKHLNLTINGVRNRQSWAMAMYDASVKVPSGIEQGAIYQFGNFDECVMLNNNGVQLPTNNNINNDDIDKSNDGIKITSKYCLADVELDGFTVRSDATRNFMLTNSTIIHWGICLPASCTTNDIEILLSTVIGTKNVRVAPEKCYVHERLTFTTIDIIYGCILSAFVSMVLFCTCYHIYMYYRTNSMKDHPKGCFEMLMKSFSLIENLKKLIKGSKDDLGLSSVNGIKAISMFFIIGGHALLFMIGGPVLNSEFYANEIKLVQNSFLINSPLLVDTFLLLSGFLFARLLLLELEKRKGKINFLTLYIFRYIRLTPAYLAIIALYATWLPKLGSGPLWQSRITLEQERCRSSWWLNLLYINNYVGTDKICMFQSWYLAADTQLFILAPLILYPLWKWRKIGLTLLGSLTIVSVIIPFVLTYINNLDSTLLPFTDEVNDITANTFFKNIYVKTHMRAIAYLFGLLTGFAVHYLQENNIKLSKKIIWICWLLAIVIGISSMASVTYFLGNSCTPIENAFYAAGHRLGWSLATGWILLACVCGYGGPLKTILGSNVFVPFSRLTYCAYLTNGLVELYQSSSIRSPIYMSIINLLGETLSHVILTFLSALVLCLIFESPIHGIEKIFLSGEIKKRQSQANENSQSTSEESA